MVRKRILAVLAGFAVLLGGGFVAAQLASAAVDDPALTGQRVWCIDANGLPHYLPAPCTQYKGMWYFGNGANLYQGTGPKVTVAPTASVTANPAPAPAPGTVAKHTKATFDADWATNGVIKKMNVCPGGVDAAGFLGSAVTGSPEKAIPASCPGVNVAKPRYYFAFTATGLPKYSASARELWGSNVSDTTMASESDVTVEGEVHPAAGATTRTFVVSIAAPTTSPVDDPANGLIRAFSNSRSFTVDAWTLVVS